MTTLLFDHEAFGEHETPPGHPERADRYFAASAALEDEAFADLIRKTAPRADRKALERVHKPSYVEAIYDIAPEDGMVRLDPDTTMGPHSLDAGRGCEGQEARAIFFGDRDRDRGRGHDARLVTAQTLGFQPQDGCQTRPKGGQVTPEVTFDVLGAQEAR